MSTIIDPPHKSMVDTQRVSVASLQRTLDSSISRRASGTKAARIVIIDDEVSQIRSLKQYLTEAGYSNFVTTSDATEAVDLVREEKPDLVLLDIAMPEVSGI